MASYKDGNQSRACQKVQWSPSGCAINASTPSAKIRETTLTSTVQSCPRAATWQHEYVTSHLDFDGSDEQHEDFTAPFVRVWKAAPTAGQEQRAGASSELRKLEE